MVTTDVKDYSLMAGVPAKKIGWVSEYGVKLSFRNNVAICSVSGEKYELKSNVVKKIQ